MAFAPNEQIARELLNILPRLNRIVARELRTEFGDETTIVQVRVLAELSVEPMTLSVLARKREVSLQAASEHVQFLVARGWVLRIPDPNDRRQSLLHLTDEGRQQLEEVRSHIAEKFLPIIEQLDGGETQALHEGLQALQRVLIDEREIVSNPIE